MPYAAPITTMPAPIDDMEPMTLSPSVSGFVQFNFFRFQRSTCNVQHSTFNYLKTP
jgi:hypothetical protein